VAKRKCRYCGRWFVPYPRVGKRQRACSIECQSLRKRENNRIYRERNPECWEGSYEYGETVEAEAEGEEEENSR
jgi:hypothetical protein